MPELLSVEDLNDIRVRARHALRARLTTTALITVHLGACGVAAGARETAQALERELLLRGLAARLALADCIGACEYEPLVDIQLPGAMKVTYVCVKPEMAARLIEEHVVQGHPVTEWVQSAS